MLRLISVPYRADLVPSAAKQSLFLSWSGWDDERLEVLNRLVSTARAGQRIQRLTMGIPADPFGRSLRSLYAAFLCELQRVHVRLSAEGSTALNRPDSYMHGLVFSVLREWASDEDVFDDTAWPEGLVDRLRETVQQPMNATSLSELVGYANQLDPRESAGGEQPGPPARR